MSKAFYALGRLPAGKMNRTEADYADLLERRKIAGDIVWYIFESVNLRLADRTFYQPDFMLMTKEGFLQVHEVKGFMQEDANVKIKVAADIYPFEFFVCRKKSKFFWNIQPISSRRVPEIISTEPTECQTPR